jgi:hypothetical protein
MIRLRPANQEFPKLIVGRSSSLFNLAKASLQISLGLSLTTQCEMSAVSQATHLPYIALNFVWVEAAVRVLKCRFHIVFIVRAI